MARRSYIFMSKEKLSHMRLDKGDIKMAFENVKELLKAVKTDPEAKKALQGLEKPKDEEGVVEYYVEAAKRLGYAVTDADIRKAIADLTKKQEEKTDAAVGTLKAMPDDELDQVAGGVLYTSHCLKTTTNCLDTFTNGENCWSNDGCDHISNYYDSYVCEHNNKGHSCGAVDANNCSQVMF